MADNQPFQPTDWREGRRLRAWGLTQKGWQQKDVAEALGVTPGAVSQWIKRAREKGVADLKRKVASGAPRRVSDEQWTKSPPWGTSMVTVSKSESSPITTRSSVWSTTQLPQIRLILLLA